MISKFLLTIIFLALAGASCFAEEATIVSVQGTVLVRDNAQAQWVEVVVDKLVSTNAEIKTVGDSQCVLAFDKQRKNIVTVKDHTEMKISGVVPGSVYLTEGRVFALIKNVQENKSFEVRTPSAISGARGTSWLTEVKAGATSFVCVQDEIFVDSLNDLGEVTGRIDLPEGSQINVEDKGVVREDIKEAPPQQMEELKVLLVVSQDFAIPTEGQPNPPGVQKGLPPIAGAPLLAGKLPVAGMPPMAGRPPIAGTSPTAGTFPIAGKSSMAGTPQAVGMPQTQGTLPIVGAPSTHGTLPVTGAPSTQGTFPTTGSTTTQTAPSKTEMPAELKFSEPPPPTPTGDVYSNFDPNYNPTSGSGGGYLDAVYEKNNTIISNTCVPPAC